MAPSSPNGNACGAIVVTRHGCANFMPYEQEVLSSLKRGGFMQAFDDKEFLPAQHCKDNRLRWLIPNILLGSPGRASTVALSPLMKT